MLALVLLLAPMCLSQTGEGTPIPLDNPSFEKPGVAKIKGWDGGCADPAWTGSKEDIPGWSSDATAFDSGVETSGADTVNGKYVAFLMAQDTAVYQMTGYTIKKGEEITLKAWAWHSWSAGTTDLFKRALVYMDSKGNFVEIVTQTSNIFANTFATKIDISLSFNADEHPAAIGQELIILFDNVTTDVPRCWLRIDYVRLFKSQSLTLVNPGFELPGKGKIKGWDGACADPAWTGAKDDIPGWSSDKAAFDSGVETSASVVEGTYHAFLMGQDTSVYQLTDYSIQKGDEITLKVWAWDSWSAGKTNLIKGALFYKDSKGKFVEIVSKTEDVKGKAFASKIELTLTFKADDHAACIGNPLGVLFDNATTEVPNAWLQIDDVRFIKGGTTGVEEKQMTPGAFALSQNYPNPFNPTTEIAYALRSSGKVRLSVYDLTGREVAVLVDGIQSAGSHTALFSASGLSSGIYFYKLRTADDVVTKRMTLLK
jgi:hypothetical protein